MAKWQELIGKTIGNWEILERDYHPTSKQHSTFYLAKCKLCNEIYSVARDSIIRNISSCCNKCKGNAWRNRIHIGDMFGYLEVMSEPFKKNNDSNHKYVKCKCHNCGRPDLIDVRISHLIGKYHSRTISCGCAQISSGELKIKEILEKNNIEYQMQYRIDDFSIYAPFDFAIFEHGKLKKLIEFDGEQHFHPIEIFGGEEKFKQQQEIDKRKNDYCKENKITLVRIPYYKYDEIEKILNLY